MKTIEKIVDELTADNLEERKSCIKNHILLMKYGMEHHELKEMTEILKVGSRSRSIEKRCSGVT